MLLIHWAWPRCWSPAPPARALTTCLAEYDTAWRYYLPDRLGSVRHLVDPAGAVQLAQSYDPFGNILSQGSTGSSAFGYTGEQVDPTGLVFLRARYYQPSTGRFLTADSVIPDPLSSQGWNRYAYVGNRPINYADPSGHQGPCAAGGLVGSTGELFPMECIGGGGSAGGGGFSGVNIARATAAGIALGGVAAGTTYTGGIPARAPEGFEQQASPIPLEPFDPFREFMPCDQPGAELLPPVVSTPLDGGYIPMIFGTPLNPGIYLPNVWETHKNDDTYVGHQGVYQIEIYGKLYKYGKADMTDITRSGNPRRLESQVNRLKRMYGRKNVTGRVIYQHKNISTLDIKTIETAYIQKYYDTHGVLPPGNQNHPGIKY